MVLSARHRAKRRAVPKLYTRQLMDVPLDVLIEIFLFLEPLDLLYLARTCKSLREFLLNRRKSSALWKNAISNVEDFPPCPDHMSPPEYTHLAFVQVCHGCFCFCETVEWDLRMRCCPDCFPEMTISQSSSSLRMKSSLQNNLDLPMALEHYKLYDYGLDIIVSIETVDPPSFSLLDWEDARSRKRPRNVSSEEFRAQQKDLWESIRTHASSCRDWEYSRLEEKAAQLSLVREQRAEDIENKLGELGYIVPSDYNLNFLQLPQVRKFEPLTPTEWADIRPQLINWAETIDNDRTWEHCITTYTSVSESIQEQLRSDTSLRVQPWGIDIAMLPAVQLALKSAINSGSGHNDLRKKLCRVLPPAIKKWSSDAVEELERLAREQLRLPLLSKPSRLPWVIFRCNACARNKGQRFRFDEALSHHHLYKERYEEDEEDEEDEIDEMFTYDKFIMEYDTYPRSIKVLRVDVTVSRRVDNLVRRMGQNPSRATYDELCRSTIKVVCGLCRPLSATRMKFEHAFQHCLHSHLGSKKTEVWTRASARE